MRTKMNSEDFAVDIGKRILLLRQEHGFTQQQVAAKAGLSDAYIGMLERGDRMAHLDVLGRVADALSVPMTMFFVQEEEAQDSSLVLRAKPLLTVLSKLKLKPLDILKAARVVWALNAPAGLENKPPV